MKFTETQREAACIELLCKEQFTHVNGKTLVREASEVLLLDDLREYLHNRYRKQGIICQLQPLPASVLFSATRFS